jgi:hypothetical protein
MSYEQVFTGGPGEAPYNQELNGPHLDVIYNQEIDRAPVATITPLPHVSEPPEEPEHREPEHGYEPEHEVVQHRVIFWDKAIPLIAAGSVALLAAGALATDLLSKGHNNSSKLVPVALGHASQLPTRFAPMPPNALPAAVEREYDSVLRVQFGELNGSGVKVARSLAWTSGDLVMPDGPGHPTESICDYDADVEGVTSTSDYGGNITNWYAQYDPASFPNHPDFSLLQVQDDPDFTDLPSAPIARTTPTRGELAYFINYEATDNTTPRYPSYSESGYLTGSMVSTAAEYAGVVLGYDNGLYMVATDLSSYGPDGDLQTHSTPGMSGGPVFSPSGTLEGISVSYRNNRATVEQVADDTGVQLDEANTQAVDISFVQPVSHSLLTHAKAKLGAAPSCNN